MAGEFARDFRDKYNGGQYNLYGASANGWAAYFVKPAYLPPAGSLSVLLPFTTDGECDLIRTSFVNGDNLITITESLCLFRLDVDVKEKIPDARRAEVVRKLTEEIFNQPGTLVSFAGSRLSFSALKDDGHPSALMKGIGLLFNKHWFQGGNDVLMPAHNVPDISSLLIAPTFTPPLVKAEELFRAKMLTLLSPTYQAPKDSRFVMIGDTVHPVGRMRYTLKDYLVAITQDKDACLLQFNDPTRQRRRSLTLEQEPPRKKYDLNTVRTLAATLFSTLHVQNVVVDATNPNHGHLEFTLEKQAGKIPTIEWTLDEDAVSFCFETGGVQE
ncbi:MAG: hypothetical protein ACYDBB_19480 [Armatimonadota bacterium]